jgi:glucan phosphoethanolaminetransferase (alkaline phosphatase superfamily)
MTGNLLMGLPTMALCLLIQAAMFAQAIRYYARRQNERESAPTFWSSLVLITAVMLLLVVGNMIQVTIWAVLFRALGEFESIRDAVYHSAVNFATLGYGDIVMSTTHRLLGPIEAINGALMIGVSTAALSAAFQDVMQRARRARST